MGRGWRESCLLRILFLRVQQLQLKKQLDRKAWAHGSRSQWAVICSLTTAASWGDTLKKIQDITEYALWVTFLIVLYYKLSDSKTVPRRKLKSCSELKRHLQLIPMINHRLLCVTSENILRSLGVMFPIRIALAGTCIISSPSFTLSLCHYNLQALKNVHLYLPKDAVGQTIRYSRWRTQW